MHRPLGRCNAEQAREGKKMTAIKVYRNAPLPAGATAPIRLHVPGWARSVWDALQRAGMRRAARHLELLAQGQAMSNPQRAAMLRETAAECRRSAAHPADSTVHAERSVS
jgi:hypothetical protein